MRCQRTTQPKPRLHVALAGPALGGRMRHGGVLHPLHVGHVVGVALPIDLVRRRPCGGARRFPA